MYLVTTKRNFVGFVKRIFEIFYQNINVPSNQNMIILITILFFFSSIHNFEEVENNTNSEIKFEVHDIGNIKF